jgi:hypothetical protein
MRANVKVYCGSWYILWKKSDKKKKEERDLSLHRKLTTKHHVKPMLEMDSALPPHSRASRLGALHRKLWQFYMLTSSIQINCCTWTKYLNGSDKSSQRYTIRYWSHTVYLFVYYFLFVGSFFPEGGVGLVAKRRSLLTLAYYAFSRWYEFGERRWNDISAGENRRTPRKTCPSATLSTTNPTWIGPGANPGLRGESPVTNDLSRGTAYL